MRTTTSVNRQGGKAARGRGLTLTVAALLITFAFGGSLGAQTLITPLWPDRGITLRDQLWNLSLANTQGGAYTGRLELTVSDATAGTPVYTGTGGLFTVAAGAGVITAQQVLPATYTQLSSSYNFNPAVNSLLPPGIFNVCYRLYRLGGEVVTLQGEGCFTLESDPLTPPSLVMPGDHDSLSTARPFFMWLAPVPSNTIPFLNYSIKVVEKGQGQSAQEAVERNLPLLTQARVGQNSTGYPAALPPLDTGKTYAWQVTAYNDNSYVAASECWVFTLSSDTAVILPVAGGAYVPLIREGSAQVVRARGLLRFSYNNEAGDTAAIFHINPQGMAGYPSETVDHVTSLIPGQNYVTIDLGTTGGLRRDTLYEVHLINARRQRWWADFIWVE